MVDTMLAAVGHAQRAGQEDREHRRPGRHGREGLTKEDRR